MFLSNNYIIGQNIVSCSFTIIISATFISFLCIFSDNVNSKTLFKRKNTKYLPNNARNNTKLIVYKFTFGI